MAAAITANAEVYGGGVGWALERINGVQIVVHNGGTVGQAAVLALVPERQFAIAVLTNSRPDGEDLHYEISTWALAEFAGLSQPLPATYDLPAARLAEYTGRYGVSFDVPGGGGLAQVVEVTPDGGGLRVTVSTDDPGRRHPHRRARAGWPGLAAGVLPRRRRAGDDGRPHAAGRRLRPRRQRPGGLDPLGRARPAAAGLTWPQRSLSRRAMLRPRIFSLSAWASGRSLTTARWRSWGIGTGGLSLPKTTWSTPTVPTMQHDGRHVQAHRVQVQLRDVLAGRLGQHVGLPGAEGLVVA